MAAYPYQSALGAAPEKPQGAEDIERRIVELGRMAERLRAALKRERFDTDARVESANFDLETLVDFVRDDIAFHPYAGTLRGATGTLRARAGNSLDQALLLAYMVRTAGYDARIVRADLTDELARRLLDASSNAPAPQSLDYFRKAISEIFGESENEQQETRPIEETQYYKDTKRHSQMLLRVLEEAEVELAPMDATERLLENIRSYFWVQYRDGLSRSWQDAHPAFGGAEPPKALEPAEFFGESIPEEYHHRFEMRAFIEQWLGGEIKKHSIMKPWSAPVANLNGVPIRFQNVPNGINRDNFRDLDAALADSNVLTPFFGKAAASGAKAFDLQGRVIDPMAQGGSPAAGVLKTVGDKFVDAATEVADRADGKPAMALHSMYLEFTFHRPGGESETRRRYLLPPRESYDENRNEVLRQLITGFTYMVATGGQPREFIADQFIEGTVNDLDWLKFVVFSQEMPEQERKLPEEPFSAFPTLFQQWNMELLPAEEGVVRFRGQPALVGIRDGFRDARTTFSEVDVVWNAVESVRRKDNQWITAPRDALTAGVWDTVLESIPLSGAQDSQISFASAPRVFDLAREQGIELIVLSPDQSPGPALEALSLDEHERQFVRRDLDAGYAVVMPKRTPDQSTMAGWWRVRTDSGETLGMLGDGYGATATEYLVVLTFVALGLTTAMKAFTEYNDCGGETTMEDKLCCATEKNMELVGEEAKDDKARDKAGEKMLEMLCGDD